MKLTGRLIITDAFDIRVRCTSFAQLREVVLAAMRTAQVEDLQGVYLRVNTGQVTYCLSGVELFRKLEEWTA